MESTIFYPLGCGQPDDIGILMLQGKEYCVTDTT